MPRWHERGVVALEFALALPVVALLVVGLLSVVGLVRASLLVQEAARLGARVAAVDPSDARVRAAVDAVVGPDATVVVGPRRVGEVVVVEVHTRHPVMGVGQDLHGRAAAMVEPATR